MLYYVDDIDYASANEFMHRALRNRIDCYNDVVRARLKKRLQLPQPQSFALSPGELDFDCKGLVQARIYR